jgi:hypothetical protein
MKTIITIPFSNSIDYTLILLEYDCICKENRLIVVVEEEDVGKIRSIITSLFDSIISSLYCREIVC